MTLLAPGPSVLEAEFLQQNPVQSEAEIIPFPLNQELVLGDYDGHTVYALGKTALEINHWLRVIRRGGFHLTIADAQQMSGPFAEVVDRQLDISDELFGLNPVFAVSLGEDIGQTRQIKPDGYLLPDRHVIDYLWLGCKDKWTRSRMAMNPVDVNVDSGTRAHTLAVLRTVVDIF